MHTRSEVISQWLLDKVSQSRLARQWRQVLLGKRPLIGETKSRASTSSGEGLARALKQSVRRKIRGSRECRMFVSSEQLC